MDENFDLLQKLWKSSSLSPTPEIRNLLLKCANDFYLKENYLSSIFCHLNSLCIQFESKNFFKSPFLNYNSRPLDDLTELKRIFNINFPESQTRNFEPNPLLSYAQNIYNKNLETSTISSKTNCNYKFLPAQTFDLHILNEMKQNIKYCQKLPKEWRIIQIIKNYNPKLTNSIAENFLSDNCSIFLIILRHERSSDYPKPITIKINISDEVFENFTKIRRDFKEVFVYNNGKNREQQRIFNGNINKFNEKIFNTIEMLHQDLGPFIRLLKNDYSNKIKNENFQKIDEFCDKFNLNDYDRVLLSLLLANGEHFFIEEVEKILFYLNAEKTEKFKSALKKFLQCNYLKYHKNYENPCLLIVDEMLDHFPWELLNVKYEICRLSSFKILQALHDKFNLNIIDGYLELNVRSANVLINPEQNLDTMEKRMLQLFQYFYPNWNYIHSKIPKSEELMDFISSNDLFIYCGHGSCMRFIKSNRYLKPINKSVVFLFGCESAKLKSSCGLHSELKGEHLYFHAGLCPAVIGCNNVVFDFQMDLMSSELITRWIKNDERKNKFINLDIVQWKKGTIKFTANQEQNSVLSATKRDSKLGKVLSDIRNNISTYSSKITLVYRGIPVIYKNNK